MRVRALSAALLACGLAWALAGPGDAPAARAGEKKEKGDKPEKKAEANDLVVLDGAGKEVRLSTWKFLSGTRLLPWLAPGERPKGKQEPASEEALELREEGSTTFQKGILTLVPVTALKQIDYDAEKMTVRVTYLRAGEKGPEEGVLTGSTRYRGINKLTLEGEVDLGELGKAAQKVHGGSAKGARSIRFPSPKPVPAAKGRPAYIIGKDKEKTVHPVTDVQALYAVSRSKAVLIPKLMFKATVKIDLAKLDRLRVPEDDREGGDGYDFEVTLKGGKQLTLTLLTETNPEDGKPAQLQGLVGRVPAGYKLFPPHTLVEVQFDKAAPPPKKRIELDARAPRHGARTPEAVLASVSRGPGLRVGLAGRERAR
jgi:hypothetical protein